MDLSRSRNSRLITYLSSNPRTSLRRISRFRSYSSPSTCFILMARYVSSWPHVLKAFLSHCATRISSSTISLFLSHTPLLNSTVYQSLLRKTFRERRSLLQSNLSEEEGKFQFATGQDATEIDSIQSFLEQSIKDNCEGLMLKTLDKDAFYTPSKRTFSWLKVGSKRPHRILITKAKARGMTWKEGGEARRW